MFSKKYLIVVLILTLCIHVTVQNEISKDKTTVTSSPSIATTATTRKHQEPQKQQVQEETTTTTTARTTTLGKKFSTTVTYDISTESDVVQTTPEIAAVPDVEHNEIIFNNSSTIFVKLCMETLEHNETCIYLYKLCKDGNYLKLGWEVIYRMLLKGPTGIIVLITWMFLFFIMNLFILFLCTLVRPFRAFIVSKVRTDLSSRYFISNESPVELRMLNNKATAATAATQTTTTSTITRNK